MTVGKQQQLHDRACGALHYTHAQVRKFLPALSGPARGEREREEVRTADIIGPAPPIWASGALAPRSPANRLWVSAPSPP